MISPLIKRLNTQNAPDESAMGGGLEGAERTTRETVDWTPPNISIDAQMSSAKPMADLRARDSVQNDGYAMGAMSIHKDSIVGAHFRMNSRPDYKALQAMGFNADEKWAEEFQKSAESQFDLIAESPNCWLDASGTKTFTEMVRLVVGSWVIAGESLAIVEWLRGKERPLRTAVNLIPPERMSNPHYTADTLRLRQGVEQDKFGRPVAAHIRSNHPGDWLLADSVGLRWMRVPWHKPWGRAQILHGYSAMQPYQTRGISDMVSVLKQMRMTRKLQEMVLQNAVIQASYAATIESELPRDMVAEMMGGSMGAAGSENELSSTYLKQLMEYTSGGKNVNIDGAKIPVLFPGTKLNVSPLAAPGGMGEDYEQSLLRHTASGLGLSYEQFARDYSQTTYSSARAASAETEKFMVARKKAAADRFATEVWHLVLEEMVSRGQLPLPGGMTRKDFYRPLVKDALGRCSWIGAGRGYIDRLKETQAALLAIRGGLSTYERETALMGEDYRDVFEQQAREMRMQDEAGLMFNTSSEGVRIDPNSTDGDSRDDDKDGSDEQDSKKQDDDDDDKQ